VRSLLGHLSEELRISVTFFNFPFGKVKVPFSQFENENLSQMDN